VTAPLEKTLAPSRSAERLRHDARVFVPRLQRPVTADSVAGSSESSGSPTSYCSHVEHCGQPYDAELLPSVRGRTRMLCQALGGTVERIAVRSGAGSRSGAYAVVDTPPVRFYVVAAAPSADLRSRFKREAGACGKRTLVLSDPRPSLVDALPADLSLEPHQLLGYRGAEEKDAAASATTSFS